MAIPPGVEPRYVWLHSQRLYHLSYGIVWSAAEETVLPFPLRQHFCHSGAREGLDAAYDPDGSGEWRVPELNRPLKEER